MPQTVSFSRADININTYQCDAYFVSFIDSASLPLVSNELFRSNQITVNHRPSFMAYSIELFDAHQPAL